MATEDKHPLQQEDYHLVQDYMITKAVMCLATNASLTEWEHEITGMQVASGEQWLRRNAMLFDYTLARILAAYGRDAHLAEADLAGPTEAFVRRFVAAVAAQNQSSAEELWVTANENAARLTGTRMRSTTPLLIRVRQTAQHLETHLDLHQVPDEYFPPQFVS
ncbi:MULTISPECIES: hypothetical protein [Microbacterium]|uniref:Uncharacterized protein n=1 Tax=Microbacterium aurantiacum TaxID=162393 RepID=A0AAJ2LYY7_9MICO|nr:MULTISPECIES: hypothetical protein [Microbacterium]MDS0245878.1 hypothetical protein [Microbacterium aurantiacum]